VGSPGIGGARTTAFRGPNHHGGGDGTTARACGRSARL